MIRHMMTCHCEFDTPVLDNSSIHTLLRTIFPFLPARFLEKVDTGKRMSEKEGYKQY